MNYVFFGLSFDMDPVAFTIPGLNWKVYWYGILITVGFVLAVIYAMKRAKSFGVNPDKLLDALIVVAPVSILCARLYFVVFDPSIGFDRFFAIHSGGMAIYGAVIGAAVAGIVMCLLRKISILAAFDLTALGFLIGQCIGRWGNFINQEAYGTKTGSSWFGISGDKIISDTGSTWPVHPCFLYESLWCFIGFLILHKMSKNRRFVGQIGSMYLVWYGFGRFFIEYLRTDSLTQGDIKVSMLLSAYLVAAGAVFLVVGFKRAKVSSASAEYFGVFDTPLPVRAEDTSIAADENEAGEQADTALTENDDGVQPARNSEVTEKDTDYDDN